MVSSINPFRTFSIILFCYSIGICAETILIPAFIHLSHYFHMNIVYVESAYGYFFYTYGLSMFFYGPLSDIFGRRPCLLFSKLFTFIGLLIVYLSYNYKTLSLGIAFMGAGLGAGGMLCRAVARDLFFGEQLLSAMTKVNIIFIIVPVLSPVIGSCLLTFFSWKSIIVFLFIFSICALIVVWFYLPESATLSLDRSLTSVLLSYVKLLSNKVFVIQIFISLLSGSIILLYEAKSAYIFQRYFSLSPIEHAFYGLTPLIGVIIATLSTTTIVKKFGSSPTLFFVNTFQLIVLLLFGLFSYYDSLSLWGVLLFFTQIFFCNAVTFSLITSQAMASCITDIGRGSALVGGIPNIGIGLIVSLVPILGYDGLFPVAVVMIALTTVLLMLCCVKFSLQRYQKEFFEI